jgi:uncharacterized protein (TIGR03067 family)
MHNFVLAAWCLTAAAASGQEPAAGKPATERLQGKWFTVEGEAAGKPVDKSIIEKQVYKFDGDMLIVENGPITLGASKFRIDDTRKPYEMDIVVGSLGTNPAIFRFDGDRLRICMDRPGGKRPTEFKTAAGTMQKMFVFERLAAPPSSPPALVPPELTGRWRAVRADQGGKPLDNAQVTRIVFEFQDKGLTVSNPPFTGTAKVSVDKAMKPMQIDLTADGGSVSRAIFAIDRDKLRLCTGEPGGDRPKEFKTAPGSRQTLYEFERERRK